ncbi:transposase [Rhizobium giardinii]|uniref:transposase n=1 Tax=Rhizobium giardinii TaxID=56731 RepID=UPI0039E13BA7
MVAAAGDGRQSNPHGSLRPRLRPTLRMHASRKKERIGRISKGGDRSLRALLIHGATAIAGTERCSAKRSASSVAACPPGTLPTNVTAVAVATLRHVPYGQC